jgi:hypothetical protein
MSGKVLTERRKKMDKKKYAIRGALLYFENGIRRRTNFQAKTTDLERIREIIKNKHNAQVVRLEYEEAN